MIPVRYLLPTQPRLITYPHAGVTVCHQLDSVRIRHTFRLCTTLFLALFFDTGTFMILFLCPFCIGNLSPCLFSAYIPLERELLP